jgi:hypothetical protein
MNCKPGDLAVLVRVNDATKQNLGRIFHVLRAESPSTYIAAFGIHEEMPRWLCRAVGGPVTNFAGREFTELAVPDFALRPIRDPGDDAQDETLSWLPVKHTEKV